MKQIVKPLKLMCFIMLIFLVAFCGVIFYIQPFLFFHPWHDEISYQKLGEMSEFEEIRIDNNGKLLSGWLKYNVVSDKAPLVIFFMGNAQNSANTCLSFLNNIQVF